MTPSSVWVARSCLLAGHLHACKTVPRLYPPQSLNASDTSHCCCCCCILLAAAHNQPHIVEIYGLTRAVSTSHLETFLLDYLWGKTGANIKWVDDEHALAVFPSAEAAQTLLESAQRDYKVRPYAKASRAALHIAPEGKKKECSWLHGCRNKGSWAVHRSWQCWHALCSTGGGVNLCLCALLSCSMRPTGGYPVRSSMPVANHICGLSVLQS
jgi:hypothetical protein